MGTSNARVPSTQTIMEVLLYLVSRGLLDEEVTYGMVGRLMFQQSLDQEQEKAAGIRQKSHFGRDRLPSTYDGHERDRYDGVMLRQGAARIVLTTLAELPGESELGRIHRKCGVRNRNTVSSALTILKQDGLVKKNADTVPSRWSITERGLDVLVNGYGVTPSS